jgi:hypothetical protein
MTAYPELITEVVKNKKSMRDVDEAKAVLGLQSTAGLRHQLLPGKMQRGKPG